MKYYVEVSSILTGWENFRDSMLEWIFDNTNIINETTSGWVDIDQSILRLSVNLFKQLKIKPIHIGLYVSRGIENHPIHTHPTREHARLNIPLLNCEGSYTVFYKTNSSPTPVKNAQQVSLYSFSVDECLEVDRTTIDKPTVIHIRTPHQVIAPQASLDKPRIMSTFQFNRDPVFLLK